MPAAPVSIPLENLSGPWQVIALTGATGAGSGMNVDYSIQPGLIQGKQAWASSTKTIEAASNGDWLVKSGATVLYRKTGSKAWPWTAGTWTGENSGTGTLALAQKNAIPTGIDREGTAYEGDPPLGIDREGTAYEGDPPVSVTPSANVSAPQIGILDGGTPSSTYNPIAVIDGGSL